MGKIKVALTHDIDRIQKTYQYFTKSAVALRNLNFRLLLNQIQSISEMNSIFWNFDKIMNIEEKYGVRSTHFFLFETIKPKILTPKTWKLAFGRYNATNPRIKSIIWDLNMNGWEIGLHGSFRSFNDPKLLSQEKQILEDILGREVYGIRQHYLNLDEQTWMYQRDAGFLYDTSFGYTRAIGFKENRVTPFRPFKDHFLEIPLVIMDSCFASDSDRWQKLDQIVQTATAGEGIIVLNWHNNNLDERDFPHYFEYYELLIKYFIDRGAKFYRMVDFYNEWLKENSL